MVAARQLSAGDAAELARQSNVSLQSEDDILRWLAGEYDVSFTALDDIEPDRQLLSLFPARILLKEELLPLRRVNGSVEIATSRLFATQGLDALKTLTGLSLKPVLAPSEILQRELKKRLGVGADTMGELAEESSLQVVDDNKDDDNDLDVDAEDASIIRFVNQVLRDAIELRASDIHLEPFEHEFQIRYRVDGVLQSIPVPSQIKRFQPAIVSRLKILSHLNIAEKRLPQDGRIKIRLDGSDVDIRVSVIPMLHGEAVVLRLLRQNSTLLGMGEMGMDARELKSFRRVLGLPHGIILVTGPTGSGKTTTLYTALNEINDQVRKIITIEDPVEYQMMGVNQIQVNAEVGLTFASGLRSILRQDPNVVMVGEIRDAETANLAVQASLTGHLVFSTLHTNSAAGVLPRLLDMNIEPFLIASTVNTIIGQRLVRRVSPKRDGYWSTPLETKSILETVGHLLPKTKEEVAQISADLGYKDLPLAGQNAYILVKGKDTPSTPHGYSGRAGLYEVMDVTEEIQKLIVARATSAEIQRKAVEQGMITMRQDGYLKALTGVTTLEEVNRVTSDTQ